MGEEELVGEVGGKEGGIVGVERDQEAAIEVAAEGMGSEGRADAGADVGGGIELEGHSPCPQVLDEILVLRSADRAWPMRSEPIESASQMASGPVVSPAWLVRRRPADWAAA